MPGRGFFTHAKAQYRNDGIGPVEKAMSMEKTMTVRAVTTSSLLNRYSHLK